MMSLESKGLGGESYGLLSYLSLGLASLLLKLSSLSSLTNNPMNNPIADTHQDWVIRFAFTVQRIGSYGKCREYLRCG